MVQHMMISRRPKPSRQPASKVKAPVNLLISNEIKREAYKDSNGESDTKEKLQDENGKRVQNEDENNHPRRRGEIDIARLFRRSSRVVMKPVALDEKSFTPMQEKPVQDVLKTVCVKNSHQKSCQETQRIKLSRVGMNQLEDDGSED